MSNAPVPPLLLEIESGLRQGARLMAKGLSDCPGVASIVLQEDHWGSLGLDLTELECETLMVFLDHCLRGARAARQEAQLAPAEVSS